MLNIIIIVVVVVVIQVVKTNTYFQEDTTQHSYLMQ